jgi:hypothetical protein
VPGIAGLAAAKEIVNQRAGRAEVTDLASTQKRFFNLLATPTSQTIVASLFARGLQSRDALESHLGQHLADTV